VRGLSLGIMHRSTGRSRNGEVVTCEFQHRHVEQDQVGLSGAGEHHWSHVRPIQAFERSESSPNWSGQQRRSPSNFLCFILSDSSGATPRGLLRFC
jgi:hypothetical protein